MNLVKQEEFLLFPFSACRKEKKKTYIIQLNYVQ